MSKPTYTKDGYRTDQYEGSRLQALHGEQLDEHLAGHPKTEGEGYDPDCLHCNLSE